MAGVDIISDSTGKEIVAAIQSTDVAQARIAEINQAAEAKKNEVLGSIPEDYSNIANEVNELRSDLADYTRVLDRIVRNGVEAYYGEKGTINNDTLVDKSKVYYATIETENKNKLMWWNGTEWDYVCGGLKTTDISEYISTPTIFDCSNGLNGILNVIVDGKKFDDIATNIPISFRIDTLLTESGAILSDEIYSGFNATDYIEIKPLSKYKITASTKWKNSYYAIYDKDKKVLSNPRSGEQLSIETFDIVTPVNAKYIVISTLGGVPESTLEEYKEISYIDDAEYIKSQLKQYLGLKWVCFGDSLTEDNTTANKRYFNFVSEETGITPLNYGKSGTGYYKAYGNSGNFLTRIEQLANVDFDIITFFGSFNDLDGGVIGDITSTDTSGNNICAFINATLDRLYELKPFVKVGIVTPTPWYNSYAYEKPENYVNALVQIAKKRGIPCLDLFHCSNLHPDKEDFRVEFYKENGVQDNGTHPNSKGHNRIYPQFREFLKTML